MRFLDWAVVGAYLVYVIWDGIRMTKHSGDVEGYFLANRSLPWWAVGLSVMATQLSAITLVGTTGQAYSDGLRFIQFYYGLPLAMVILCVTAVPFFYRAQVYTAYEYLEKRFDAKTRSLTSFCFLISRGLGVGVVIAAPSVILSIVLGWDEVTTIFVMGLSTTFYTMVGGVQAVTWTDVKQMIVIFFGLSDDKCRKDVIDVVKTLVVVRRFNKLRRIFARGVKLRVGLQISLFCRFGRHFVSLALCSDKIFGGVFARPVHSFVLRL